jgi:membrane associated rhomboid family serine protease
MPLADRNFGSSSSGSLPDGVKWLLIVNAVVFVAEFFTSGTSYFAPFRILGLVPRSVVESLALWQLFTYMFLHAPGDLTHILFNMLTLYWIGTALEQTWGKRRFLRFYILCGLGAGVSVVVLNYVFRSPDVWTIGASGAIYGLLLAFGILFPDAQMLFMFLFPMKARHMVLLLGAISFLLTFRASGGAVSHVAHLGGLVTGFFLLKSRSLPAFDVLGAVRQRRREWKFRRAKKKFQVYLKKRDPRDPDPWVH